LQLVARLNLLIYSAKCPDIVSHVADQWIGVSIHVGIDVMIKRKESEAALISLPEMADRLGVPPLWLKEQAEAGRVPHLKVGRKLMFAPTTAEAAVLAMAGDSMAKLINDLGGAQ
jgi:hypothetical protein